MGILQKCLLDQIGELVRCVCALFILLLGRTRCLCQQIGSKHCYLVEMLVVFNSIVGGRWE